MAKEKFQGLFKTEAGTTHAYKPDTGEYVAVRDVRQAWKDGVQENTTTKEERQAFYQQRIQLIESSEGRDELRRELLENLNESVKAEEAEPDDSPEPVPGGVGYGAYFKPGMFRFTDSSALYYKIVTVPQIGNEQNQWLYLTSTNRAPRGVEAYVAYRRQDTPMFKVFDWSKPGPARFALSRPYDSLADYLTLQTAEGVDYQIVNVMNSTKRIGETRWVNEVMLLNQNTSSFDLVYSHEYDLEPIDETKYLWWGPIVETFPPFPFTINDLGFFDAQLLQDGADAVFLTDAFTDLKKDHVDPTVVFERRNYSFIVHW